MKLEELCNKNTITKSIQKIYRNICYFKKGVLYGNLYEKNGINIHRLYEF